MNFDERNKYFSKKCLKSKGVPLKIRKMYVFFVFFVIFRLQQSHRNFKFEDLKLGSFLNKKKYFFDDYHVSCIDACL